MSSSRGWVVMGATALAGGLGAAALARGRSTGAVKPAMDHQDAVSARNEDAARLLQHARAVIAAAQFGVLCTNRAAPAARGAGSGAPNCRAVAPVAPTDGFAAIALATNPRTRKVEEIKRDNEVALTYLDGSEMSYVTVTGRMHIFESAHEKKSRWRPEWVLFYPRGPESGFVPMELSPARIEVVRPAVGVAGPEDSWRPPALVRGRDGLWTPE